MLTVLALAASAPVAAGCDDDDRPAAPVSLKAVPLGSGGITLQWSSNVGHYDIYIRDKWGRPVPEAPDIIGGATNENYHDFYGLRPDKEYFFSIRARTEGGTQGCISKNASETVSAKTDSAELNHICSNYAKTVMEEIQEMTSRGCALPGSSFSGLWARNESAHFTACLETRRAGLQGDAKAEWVRHQQLVECKEAANKCTAYRNAAVSAARKNRIFGCGYTGARWTSNGSAHYSWCMGQSPFWNLTRRETRARTQRIHICLAKRANAAQGSASSGGGNSGDACTGVPAEWAGMLKAHNDERAKFCGAPLTWSCDLATQAQSYATECVLNEHGANNENMADMWNSAGSYPAGTDAEAFEAVWGCERSEYHFDAPEIVGGFKDDCHKGKDGGKPVNGHFTQVVWRANTAVGCGRAKCTMTDKEGKTHQGTHWVCRYSPGGNNPGALAQNVQKPPCAQSFRSKSEPEEKPTCSRGMVKTASGLCACPPGARWAGMRCQRMVPSAQPSPAPATPPPSRIVGCPSSRPVGTLPNCCPEGTAFGDGVCRRLPAPVRNSLVSGRNASTGKPSVGVCPRSRPVGPWPHCCPKGMTFRGGMCRHDFSRGTSSPNDTSTQNTPTGGGCPRSRPVGTPPCCPAGTSFQNGKCIRPTPQTTPGSATQPDTSSRTCTGGRIGRPPHCRCPAGTRYLARRCRRIPTTSPKPTCPSGLTGPKCDQVIVR